MKYEQVSTLAACWVSLGSHHPRVAETLRNLAVMKYEQVSTLAACWVSLHVFIAVEDFFTSRQRNKGNNWTGKIFLSVK